MGTSYIQPNLFSFDRGVSHTVFPIPTPGKMKAYYPLYRKMTVFSRQRAPWAYWLQK
jgi:hypothetical protein